jgi:hypothetical protein
MCSFLQPVATGGNGFGLFEPLLGRFDLQPVATGCNHGAPQWLHILWSVLIYLPGADAFLRAVEADLGNGSVQVQVAP